MSLAFWKREKNFIALVEKGYERDPEGFSYTFLKERVEEEVKELDKAIRDLDLSQIVKECADISNLVDFIASKAIMKYPTKYFHTKG